MGSAEIKRSRNGAGSRHEHRVTANLFTDNKFVNCQHKISRSLRHVGLPLLLDEDAQESVSFDVVRDGAGVDAHRARLSIVDDGLQVEDNSVHFSCRLAKEDRL